MATKNECIAAYRKHLHLKNAANQLGIKFQTLYWRLKKYGEPVVGDKARYGSETDKFAARVEARFQQLVPKAIDKNMREFQSKVDFDVHGLKVDVKGSRLHVSNHASKKRRWAFSVKKQEVLADFIVCLGFDDKETLVKCLLIPYEVFRFRSSISLSESGGKWNDYEIKPNDLAKFFDEISDVTEARSVSAA